MGLSSFVFSSRETSYGTLQVRRAQGDRQRAPGAVGFQEGQPPLAWVARETTMLQLPQIDQPRHCLFRPHMWWCTCSTTSKETIQELFVHVLARLGRTWGTTRRPPQESLWAMAMEEVKVKGAKASKSLNAAWTLRGWPEFRVSMNLAEWAVFRPGSPCINGQFSRTSPWHCCCRGL